MKMTSGAQKPGYCANKIIVDLPHIRQACPELVGGKPWAKASGIRHSTSCAARLSECEFTLRIGNGACLSECEFTLLPAKLPRLFRGHEEQMPWFELWQKLSVKPYVVSYLILSRQAITKPDWESL